MLGKGNAQWEILTIYKWRSAFIFQYAMKALIHANNTNFPMMIQEAETEESMED